MTGAEVDRARLTSPDRLVWPEAGVTKRDVVDYYTAVAPVLLPHLAGRPVTLARFPEGVDRYGWYQTQCRGPAWLPRRRVGTQDYCVVDGLEALLWAVNAGTIEFQPLLSRGKPVDEPTAVVFDLDPGPPAGLADCCRIAVLLREVLEAVGLAPLPKTTGSLGLHVFAPLAAGPGYGTTKGFARRIAEELAERRPEDVVATTARSARTGKILVDWGQNAEARSTIAPYSLRAMRLPTVSTPLTWDEVEDAASRGPAHALVFTPAAVLERVERLGDLFRPVLDGGVRLPA